MKSAYSSVPGLNVDKMIESQVRLWEITKAQDRALIVEPKVRPEDTVETPDAIDPDIPLGI